MQRSSAHRPNPRQQVAVVFEDLKLIELGNPSPGRVAILERVI